MGSPGSVAPGYDAAMSCLSREHAARDRRAAALPRCSTDRRRSTGCRGSRRRSAAASTSGSSARISCRSRSAGTSCGTWSSSSARRSPKAPTRWSPVRPALVEPLPADRCRRGAGRPRRPPGAQRPAARRARRQPAPRRAAGRHRPRRRHRPAGGPRGARPAGDDGPPSGREAAVPHRNRRERRRSGRPVRSSPGWRRSARPGLPAIEPAAIVLPSATGGTHAGILAGPGSRAAGHASSASPSPLRRSSCARRSQDLLAGLEPLTGVDRRPGGDRAERRRARPRLRHPDRRRRRGGAAPRSNRGHLRRPGLHGQGARRARRPRPRRPATRAGHVLARRRDAGPVRGPAGRLSGTRYWFEARQASRSLIRPAVWSTAPE